MPDLLTLDDKTELVEREGLDWLTHFDRTPDGKHFTLNAKGKDFLAQQRAQKAQSNLFPSDQCQGLSSP